ncbi:hypothetical protein IAR55_002360 [Kwoniella newhampshirensis]|uniref:Uncharacterized protein n=1 Tax=Kwoniella newhampshirensis TaxID=1651941 RepID=A0AAW0Z139_9TREE
MSLTDPSLCPPYLTEPIHTMLDFLWTRPIPIIQPHGAPYDMAAEVLSGVLESIEEEEEDGAKEEEVGVVDFGGAAGRGSGGPALAVERKINQHRQSISKRPIRFVLTNSTSWTTSSSSPSPPSASSSSVLYIPESVDARHATASQAIIRGQRHLRTFFSTFHQFGEDSARRVMVDAFEGAEGMCIFELQQSDLASLLMVALLGPLSWLLLPFQRPTWTTLFFTYIVPIIPLLLVLDGILSVYRSRSIPHLLRLVNLASLNFHLEGGGGKEEFDWKWEYGKKRHTWPFGQMVWVVGRRDRRGDRGGEGESESDEDLGVEEGVEDLI